MSDFSTSDPATGRDPTSRSAFRLLAKGVDATNRDADQLRKALLAQWNERSGAHRLVLQLEAVDPDDGEARLATWFSLCDPGDGHLVGDDDPVLDGITDDLRKRLTGTARPD